MLIQHAAGLFNNLIYLPNLTILISNINNWLRKSKLKSPIRAFTKAGRLRTWTVDCSPVSSLLPNTQSLYWKRSIDLYICLCANTTLSWWLWLCSIVWSQAGWFLQFHTSFSRLLWLFKVFCISIQIVKLLVLVLWKIPLVAW